MTRYLESFEEARDAYKECLVEHPDDPDRCEDLRIEANRRFDDYESAARMRYGCRTYGDQCLPSHGPGPP